MSNLSDSSSTEYCCKLKCFETPEDQCDSIECEKCSNPSFCLCKCKTEIKRQELKQKKINNLSEPCQKCKKEKNEQYFLKKFCEDCETEIKKELFD